MLECPDRGTFEGISAQTKIQTAFSFSFLPTNPRFFDVSSERKSLVKTELETLGEGEILSVVDGDGTAAHVLLP